ncbi:hypothetical protein OAG52_03280, partial [Verrucomicrobia bacterium]|nr:hypothetical protein [Verrucomicrobiota bacterium]
MREFLIACCFIFAIPNPVQSQGTVNFANIGGDFDPVSGPDGLLGPEFEAQLQLADGTNLQDPASFLESPIFSGGSHGSTGPSGIFSGGSRSIPGY